MIHVTVPDMTCSACSDTITQAISALDGQARVEANLTTKEIMIETCCSEPEIKAAIATVGYTPT